MSILYYLMLVLGALIFIAAVTNWDWYFKQRRAQTMIKLMGRNGARILYAVLGLLFVFFAWMVLNGRIDVG
ncbi:immunity 17 family protein [Carboxylicivirga sp. N1Y90]|uniref:immunity 17 family protein n=1 Tax=Carboxylicivirga fragile TaxID=3417571 RepID=UPI003D335923|nr:immunity 17 family protein [Marinilabiliaceae bacterium N1Y90]